VRIPLSGFKFQVSSLRSPLSSLKPQVSAFKFPLSAISSAFSLIELLVVVAIIALMTVVTLPSISGVNQAGAINRAGQTLGDLVILARQEAVSKNRDIEVRVIDLADPMYPGYRAIQLWIADEIGASSAPLGKIQKFPEGIVLASNTLSPLLTSDTSVAGTTNFGALGSRPYKGFRVRASGALPPAIGSTNNFLTVQLARDADIPPKNFYTIRVNPITGRVTVHRP